MPATAVRLLRKMRGGAQSHLIEADDGHFYVVKFRGNPQGRRILLNEWFGCHFLRYLGIACPEAALVRINDDFLDRHPGAGMQFGSRVVRPETGWHFGSRYPGHPDRTAVYDFVPDTLLGRVENLIEFAGMLVFDKWACNADARQSVFIRARVQEYAPATGLHPRRMGFVALMIDHGYLFNGPHWECVDTPAAGLYFRPLVYHTVRRWEDLQPWLDRVEAFPDYLVDEAYRAVPPEWIGEDAAQLECVLETLLRRRGKVADLVADCIRHRPQHFPNWQER
jgi:hypothetical protein